MSKILVVGLNPAWQRVLSLGNLQPGSVNRALEFHTLASGKGINAAKVLAKLGHDVSLVQILAGENGNRCLACCESWNLRSLHAWTQGETRVCITLCETNGRATEVIEPFSVTESDVSKKLLDEVDVKTSYDALLVCGTAPPGIPESIYGEILSKVNAPLVIWDSVMGLTFRLLEDISWLKLNREEFVRLSGLMNLSKMPVLITEGPKAASVAHSQSSNGNFLLPQLASVRNPIGAGDTVTAALADGFLRGLDEETSIRRSLAFGTASCLTVLPAEWNMDDVESLIPQIRREAA
ncbi:MAG TPA: hypothetical protein DCQ83_06530 [Fibrobacteres bacterium]|nr:hypothetical protein [Fibrobacterota bacterium]